MGWGLSGALSGLKQNQTLRQLRIRNHDVGAAEDVTELCRVIAANKGLAMFDCQSNNFNHHQFSKIVHALNFNHQIISFPITDSDRQYALDEEKRMFTKGLKPGKGPQRAVSKTDAARLDALLIWLKGHWDSEAKKAEGILQRNRDDPTNHLLELDSEYLSAWDDDKLPSWLKTEPSYGDKGKDKEFHGSHSKTLGPNPLPAPPTAPTELTSSHRHFKSSETSMHTYTIEEEDSSVSEYAQSPIIESPNAVMTADEARDGQGNGPLLSPASAPEEYQQIVECQDGKMW
jgi:hypothetical protein